MQDHASEYESVQRERRFGGQNQAKIFLDNEFAIKVFEAFLDSISNTLFL